MRSIRKFVYVAALMLSVFAVLPSLATAEDAAGHFTLTHEVLWQKQVLPAGDYAFTVQSMGPSELLMVRNLSDAHFNAMMLATDVEASKPGDTSRLVLVSKDGHSFVSVLDLPQLDMVLRFRVPSDSADGHAAAETTVGAGTSAR